MLYCNKEHLFYDQKYSEKTRGYSSVFIFSLKSIIYLHLFFHLICQVLKQYTLNIHETGWDSKITEAAKGLIMCLPCTGKVPVIFTCLFYSHQSILYG